MKTNLKDILVPFDFNAPALNALAFAINAAKQFDGRIHLLYVIEPNSFVAHFLQSGDYLVKITGEIKDKLDAIAKKEAASHSVKIVTCVERGKVYRKILEKADKLNPRMIVLGENHKETGEKHVLGRTVHQVSLLSSAPVLTLKGEHTHFGPKMVVPLDLTKETRKQVSMAIHYGKYYGESIHLVSALVGGIYIEESRIHKKLENAKQTIRKNGVECDMKLYPRSEAPPYKRVLEYTKEIGGDIIMLLTHQEGYTFDNYIGAFAHHVINESEVPVLSLTAKAVSHSEDMMKTFIDPLGYLFR